MSTRRVPDPDEPAAPAVDDPARRVRERDVPEQREAEPCRARSRPRRRTAGAVLPRSDQDREAEERHQQAHPVRRAAASQASRPVDDRRPADDARPGATGSPVWSRSPWSSAERDRRRAGPATAARAILGAFIGCRSRAARTASPVSSVLRDERRAPPLRPSAARDVGAVTARDEQDLRDRARAAGRGRGRSRRGQVDVEQHEVGPQAARPRRAPTRRPRPHRSRRTPRARAAFVPSAGTARGRPRSRRSGASGESSHAREAPATGLTGPGRPRCLGEHPEAAAPSRPRCAPPRCAPTPARVVRLAARSARPRTLQTMTAPRTREER